MPQTFHVLRCYSCETFQVHQVTKSAKFACKLCGEKQSIIRAYGTGAAPDMRHRVRALNMARGEVEAHEAGANGDMPLPPALPAPPALVAGAASEWDEYVPAAPPVMPPPPPDDPRYVTEMPSRGTKRPRQQSRQQRQRVASGRGGGDDALEQWERTCAQQCEERELMPFHDDEPRRDDAPPDAACHGASKRTACATATNRMPGAASSCWDEFSGCAARQHAVADAPPPPPAPPRAALPLVPNDGSGYLTALPDGDEIVEEEVWEE